MTLLAVERIKLFSTRSPWWCMGLAVTITVGFTALVAANSGGAFPLTVSTTQAFHNFGLMVIMVMAALSVTTEYRFNTIRATFQAVPNRTSAMLAKTVVVAVLAAVVGEIIAFGSWAVARVVKPSAGLSLHTSADWRNVAGVGLVFGIGAIIAMAVGMLVRQTAGAVAILLVYSLLIESLITLIPTVGPKIQMWMPFQMSNHFLNGGVQPGRGGQVSDVHPPFGPWGSLAYFAGVALVLLAAALMVTNRRDA